MAVVASTAPWTARPDLRKPTTNRRFYSNMNEDRIAGAAKQAKGALKESVGKALGDNKMTADGKSDKIEGKIQNAIGGLRDALKK